MSTRKYKRKTIDEWHILVWYGSHGWEHETTETSWKDARAQLKCYRENCPQYASVGNQLINDRYSRIDDC